MARRSSAAFLSAACRVMVSTCTGSVVLGAAGESAAIAGLATCLPSGRPGFDARMARRFPSMPTGVGMSQSCLRASSGSAGTRRPVPEKVIAARSPA